MNLSKRLAAAAALVRPCEVCADVGTDHAWLPVWLVNKGICRSAVASDINEGPLQRADRNIRENGCTGKIRTLRTDGLAGLEAFSPTEIIIAGMGGELIARILADAPWVKQREIRLILQPMTKSEALRRWLWDNGFVIAADQIVRDDKLYELMAASWTGERTPYDQLELLLGKFPPSGEDYAALAAKKAANLRNRLEGMAHAGQDSPDDRALLARLEQLSGRK